MEQIGSGGSGQVWKGLWKSNGCKTVAIKKVMELPEREVGSVWNNNYGIVQIVTWGSHTLNAFCVDKFPSPTTSILVKIFTAKWSQYSICIYSRFCSAICRWPAELIYLPNACCQGYTIFRRNLKYHLQIYSIYVNHNLDQVWCIGDENVISDGNVDATFHFKLNNSGEGSMQKMSIAVFKTLSD